MRVLSGKGLRDRTSKEADGRALTTIRARGSLYWFKNGHPFKFQIDIEFHILLQIFKM
jgi:hypothetical protein